MRTAFAPAAVMMGLLAACAGNIKPSERLDEETGMTVGALQQPIEFVENAESAGFSNSKRTSFAYLGPIEWDRMGEISYGVWIHIAPGNDKQVSDIHSRGVVTLMLDDGPMPLSPMETPGQGRGPYKPVASWGQTSYYDLNADMLKRMAASSKCILSVRAADDSRVDFLPSHDTRATLSEFAHTRGITDD